MNKELLDENKLYICTDILSSVEPLHILDKVGSLDGLSFKILTIREGGWYRESNVYMFSQENMQDSFSLS